MEYNEYEPEPQYVEDDDDEEITQEDAWAVISAYFEEKGLVRQQLDSFDEFIQNTMQEIVDESADIEIRPESQHNPGHQSDFAEVVSSFLFFSRVSMGIRNYVRVYRVCGGFKVFRFELLPFGCD
jgi:DNA-directed RNA polymerase II subunit RPB2|uniref:DNA-directed RNA polymerase n=1 Tax=Arabidopsis thaliana TaxID=3702 RepID=Q67XZ1_ARATH|nr:DNA-directed RNA polymerase II second largest chain [Arabidopsis thaliana]